MAALPSLALEAQRQALISEAKRLDQEIDQGNTDARERLRALKDELRRLLDRIRETRDTERSAFPSRRRHPEVVAQAPYRLAPGDHAVCGRGCRSAPAASLTDTDASESLFPCWR